MEVWLLPVPTARGPQGPVEKKIISDPGLRLCQPHFSPDGQWIVFEAVRNSAQIGIHTLCGADFWRTVDSNLGRQELG